MFFSLLFLCSIHFVISLRSQEDLSILKYSQIGCLILKSDKQFLVNNIQENFLLPYQTFSSSHMTIELCFRLCRRWIILLYNNQTNCICLYTINKPYEFNEYFGEFLSNDNCKLNDVQIYSLTEDIYIFPLLLTSTSDDWSLDGCYYLQGIQTVRVSLRLNHVDYIQAIDLCRKHCQTIPKIDYYSYFLSRKKSCYCLPLKLSQKLESIALRKPLKHCSFLPYICRGFSNSCEKYFTETNLDTLIKINVQNYCLSTKFISFIFDRIFYMCFKSILLTKEMTFSIIYYNQKCLSLIIKTSKQWNYLIQSSWITHSKIFISIDRNSTYIFNDLFKYNNLTLLSNNLCIVIYRTELNKISYELIQCTVVHSPGYVLCAQKPVQSMVLHEEEFQMITNDSQIPIDEILSCPSEFILFNKICYYVHPSFIYNIRSAEGVCYNQYSNSTLVKLSSQEWGNINATRFLGRTFDDILLEFFYYLLEKKLYNQTINEANKKHWLRLFLSDKNDSNECVLRYFDRSSGAFTILHQCNNGGHPVCQCQPIRIKIPSIIETISNKNNSFIETTTTQIIVLNSTNLLTTIESICENCTTNLLADEDLVNNETKIDSESSYNISIEMTTEKSKKKFFIYRPLLIILTGPALAFVIFFIGVGLLIRHLRQNHGSYSMHSSMTVDFHRTKRSSTILTTSDLPNTPAVLYTRLKAPRISSTETDMLLPLDNSISPNDDNIEMLLPTKLQVINVNDDNEE